MLTEYTLNRDYLPNDIRTNQFGRINSKFTNYVADSFALQNSKPSVTPHKNKSPNSGTKAQKISSTQLPKIVQNRNKTIFNSQRENGLRSRPFALQEIAAKARREASTLRKKLFRLENEMKVKEVEVKMVRERFASLQKKLGKEKSENIGGFKTPIESARKMGVLKGEIAQLKNNFSLLKKSAEKKQRSIFELERRLREGNGRGALGDLRKSKEDRFNGVDSSFCGEFCEFDSAEEHFLAEKLSLFAAKIAARVECLAEESHSPLTDLAKRLPNQKRGATETVLGVICGALGDLHCNCLLAVVTLLTDMTQIPSVCARICTSKLPLLHTILSALLDLSVDHKNPSELSVPLLSALYDIASHPIQTQPGFSDLKNFIFDGHFGRIVHGPQNTLKQKICALKIARHLAKDADCLSFLSKCFVDESDSPLISLLKDFDRFGRNFSPLKKPAERDYNDAILAFMAAICEEQRGVGIDILLNLSSFVCKGGLISMLANSAVTEINNERKEFFSKENEFSRHGAFLAERLKLLLVLVERTGAAEALRFHFRSIFKFLGEVEAAERFCEERLLQTVRKLIF